MTDRIIRAFLTAFLALFLAILVSLYLLGRIVQETRF